MTLLEKIKLDLPNVPDEVIEMWIKPYAEDIGWPPVHHRWVGILTRPIEVWRKTGWSKEKISLEDITLTPQWSQQINGMHEAYNLKRENLYKEILGQMGKQRYLNIVKYLLASGVFPKPIILFKETDGYIIPDGNHRFLAWIVTLKVHNELKMAPENLKESFMNDMKNKWGIAEVSPLSDLHETWIARLQE